MKTQPSTEAPTGLARRSFLGGLVVTLPATAIGATAVRAASEAQSEIDAMIALRDRWRELDGQTLAIENRLAELELDYLAIADVPPAGLAIRPADFRLLKEFGSSNVWQEQTHFDGRDVRAMRKRTAMRYSDRFV